MQKGEPTDRWTGHGRMDDGRTEVHELVER